MSSFDVIVCLDLSMSFAMLQDVLFLFGFSVGPRVAHIRKTAFALSFKILLK